MLEFAFDDLLVKALHVVCAERRNQGTHLIKDAAERPDITLRVIGLITPYLWTCVIGCASLCVTQFLFDNLAYIEISKLGLHVLEQEQVCTFHVSVKDFSDVKGF